MNEAMVMGIGFVVLVGCSADARRDPMVRVPVDLVARAAPERRNEPMPRPQSPAARVAAVATTPRTLPGDERATIYTCALLEDGRVKCWGRQDDRSAKAVGDEPGEMGHALPVVDLGLDEEGLGLRATHLAVADSHACAVLTTGDVHCWGDNVSSQLGYQPPSRFFDTEPPPELHPPIGMGAHRRAVALSLGDRFSCAILDSGSVKCWGENEHRQLGIDTCKWTCSDVAALPTVNLGGVRVVGLDSGAEQSCGLTERGRVRCWGNDYGWGSLGQGAAWREERKTPEQGLPHVDLGIDRRATAVAVGYFHACALLDNGEVKCWGANNGCLGLGTTDHVGADDGQMGAQLPPVDLGATATAISAGAGHNCALLQGGALKCWGFNDSGQLGLGDTRPRGGRPGEMGAALPAVDLGSRRAVAVSAGDEYTCALLEDGAVKCWGGNQAGQLGLGDTNNRGDEPGEMGDALPDVDVGP